MTILLAQAAATSLYEGRTYGFCARTCKEQFDQDPEPYLDPAQLLPQYARRLYEALGTLQKAVYGPVTHAGIGKHLTEVEWEALRVLGRLGECRMRQLAAACEVALSTMTGVVDRLVNQRLVQRRHSESDRRVVLVDLSGRGKLAYAERLDADMRLVLTMLQALDAQEQQAFMELVQKIVGSLAP